MTANNRTGEPHEESSDDPMPPIEEMDLQDTDIEAYMQLNQELDEISNCLDALEKKNDNLHEELFKLLQENKQIRSEMKNEKSGST